MPDEEKPDASKLPHILDFVDPAFERNPLTRLVALLRISARRGRIAHLLPETAAFLAKTLEDIAALGRNTEIEPQKWTVEEHPVGEAPKTIGSLSDLTAANGAWEALMAANPNGRYVTAQKIRVMRNWKDSDPEEIRRNATAVAMRALAREEVWRQNWNPEYELDEDIVCNHYTQRASLRLIMEMTQARRDEAGNVRDDIYPNYEAPIVRLAPDGTRVLANYEIKART